MGYQFTILCYVRFFSGLLAILLAFFLWRRRRAQGALYLMIFEILAAIWAISDGMEAAALTIPQKIFWSQIAYVGITSSAVMFLMFSLSYTRNYTFSKNRILYLLLVIPLITVVLAFTGTHHKFLWSDIVLLPETRQAVYYYGPWFWVNVTYQYSLIVIGIVILIAGAFRVYTIHRIQTWLLLLSVILPFAASILYIFKLMPVKGIDLTPIAFIFSGILIGFSLYRLDFFNIIPIAHRQTIDNLDDGIAVLDALDRVMNINPAFTKATGMAAGDITGKEIASVLSLFGLSLSDFSGQNDFKAEAGVEKGGDQKYFELKIQPVTDTSGRQVGRLIIIRDNTLNKMILDAVTESNLSRKRELVEKEKLIMDLDAYARMVAHDLKNPLGAVTSFTYLIQDALKANKIADAAEMIDMLQGESNKMNRIIDDLLLLSRIRQEDIKIGPVDIKGIINEALNRQHNLIARKNAEIEMPETWPSVYGHSSWVEQVWINLINNALKYGGNPPEIKIGYTREAPSLVRFWIKDNGNGLPPASLQKLFNDFERLGNKDTDGTGLGLSIVKRLINKMGGVISVESTNKPGEGCTFSFSLMSEKKSM
jgi:PAS domain S-box-containing protein